LRNKTNHPTTMQLTCQDDYACVVVQYDSAMAVQLRIAPTPPDPPVELTIHLGKNKPHVGRAPAPKARPITQQCFPELPNDLQLLDPSEQLASEPLVPLPSQRTTMSHCFGKGRPRATSKPRRTLLGEWLTEQRQQRGLRQSDIAAQLGINQGRIAEWEQGQKPIPDGILLKLREFFNRNLPLPS
jgi:helix-turn-helix protein